MSKSTGSNDTIHHYALKWPVAFDEKGELVTPDQAKSGKSYHFEFGAGSNAITIPLILRAATVASNNEKEENQKRRKVIHRAHFAISSIGGSTLEDFVSSNLSSWHMLWQCFAQKQYREIKIADNRADIRTPQGTSIEVQRSRISVLDVENRLKQYKEIVWILDAMLSTIKPLGSLRDATVSGDISDEANQYAIEITAFKSSAVLTTLQNDAISLPFDEQEDIETKTTRTFTNYLDRFRFATPAADEKEIQPGIKKKLSGVTRIYLDIGCPDWIFRVNKCSHNSGPLRCTVTAVTLESFLTAEFGAALVQESVLRILMEQRKRLIELECDHIRTIDEFKEASSTATADGWRRRVGHLTTQLALRDKRLVEVERSTQENNLLKQVAKLCGNCGQAFPWTIPSLTTCLCCVQRSVKRVDDGIDIDCFKCGKFFVVSKLKQEPSSGRFFCSGCAHPCSTPKCRNFGFSKFLRCTACFQIKK